MRINTKTPIYVYGAGVLGHMIVKRLVGDGFNNVYLIDSDVNKCKRSEVDVFHISDIKNAKLQDDSVCIISVLNVFYHDEIAKKMREIGFKHIFFKCGAGRRQNDENAYVMNKAFDLLYLADFDILGIEVPYYDDIKECEDYYFEGKEGYVRCLIPAELLLYDNAFYKNRNTNNDSIPAELKKNSMNYVMFYLKQYSLFRCFFENTTESNVKEYYNYYRTTREFEEGRSVSNEDMHVHLTDRYRIYNQMQLIMTKNPSFFHDNPISVSYAKERGFVVVDGLNRLSFLLSKRMFDIPCRIKKNEWDEYVENVEYNSIQNWWKRNNTFPYYPIFLPGVLCECIYNQESYREILLLINQWIEDGRVAFESLIEINAKNGYFSLFYSQLGCEVTAVERDKDQVCLLEKMIHLLDTHISVVSSLDEVNDELFDLAIIHCSENDDLSVVEMADKLSRKALIMEVEYCEGLFNRGEIVYCRFDGEGLRYVSCEKKY